MKNSQNWKRVRDIVPNFDDPKAVIREYTDNYGNLQKIEIFYGGKYGGDSEGHGHWVAENIDDIFQVTLDRNPDKVDGGKHLIESNHKNNAYNDEARLERIRSKQAVIEELRYLDPASHGLGGKVIELRNRLYNCGSCGHDDNQRLKDEFESVANTLFNERTRIFDGYRYQKESLITEAERLAYSTDFTYAKEQMRSLQERWKLLARASKEDEDSLWGRFKQASDRLYDNAKRDYEERKRKQEDAKRQKESLISQAESLAYSTDFAYAKEQMRSLQEHWKQLPRASKEDENSLWERFKRASDRLYDNAKRDFEERKRKQEDARRQKESLINQAESLSYGTDLKYAKEQMRSLQERWKQLPRASKEDEDSLWMRFKQASDRLYDKAKMEFEERRRKQEDARRQKESLIDQAESLVCDTDFKNAKEQMRSLQERWKQLPRASKEDEDSLWARFKQVSDRLYENAKRASVERQSQQNNAKIKKERIISQIESLVSSVDYRSAAEEIKRLSDEYFNAGSAGKDNQFLKERFNQAKERFFAAKKMATEQKHHDFVQRLQERYYRKQEALSRLDTAIYNKREQLSNLLSRPEPSNLNPNRWDIAARRNAKESQLNAAISDMQMKRESLINEIMDLQSKING